MGKIRTYVAVRWELYGVLLIRIATTTIPIGILAVNIHWLTNWYENLGDGVTGSGQTPLDG